MSILFLLLSLASLLHFERVQAQQSIKFTSASGEPSFIQTITLICTHPDPLQDLDKYQPDLIAWAENGAKLDYSQPATLDRFKHTRLNSTASALFFAMDVSYLAIGVTSYSCFLVLTGGGREESDPILIHVEEAIQTMKGNNSNGIVSTTKNWYDFTEGNYTVNISATIVGLNLNESEPLSVGFTAPRADQAQQSVNLTSSGEVCVGQTVTLTCTHPDPLKNPTKYQPEAIAWAENDTRLDFSLPTTLDRFTRTRLNSTTSTLTFTVTEKDHANRVVTYSCFLLLTGDGGGGREESNRITMDVEELSSPVLTSTTSLESSITVEWLAANCSRSYNISWQCMEPSSTGSTMISTTNTNITVPVDSNSKCSLSLVAVYGDGSTGPVTTAAVYPGFPRPANASSSTLSCTSRSLLLTCQFGGGEYTDIQWNSSQGPVGSSSGPLLTIDDAIILQQGTEFWCSGVPEGGTATYRVRGESYVYNNESLPCGPTTAPPPAEGIIDPAAGAAVVPIAAVGVFVVIVGVVVFRRRSTSKVDSGNNEDSAPLTALIVAQALSSAGVDVLTVRGCCASSRCHPCTCDWQPGGRGAMDLLCRYRQKTVALHILSSQKDKRTASLETIREVLSTAEHCFALWPALSVPRKIEREVSRAIVPKQNEEQCVTVLALPGLPWGAECRERKTFVEQVMAVLDPQLEPIAVYVETEEESVAALSLQQPLPVCKVDVLRLVHNLFVAKPVATDHKDQVWSMYATVSHQKEETDSSAQPPVPLPATPLIPDVVAPGLTTAVENYNKSEVIEGLCSVLTLLGAEILSVEGTCRRRDCVASNDCQHCDVYQPDIEAKHHNTTFTIKYCNNRIDGAVTTYHMVKLNYIRKHMGLSLGILLYDVVGNSPLPDSAENCTLFAIGHYRWGTPWIKRALVVMYAALKMTAITVDNLTSPPDDVIKCADLDCSKKILIISPALENVACSEVVTDGTALDPPKQSVKKNKHNVFKDDPKDVPYQDDILSVLEKKGVKVVEKTAGAFVGTFHSVQFLAVCRAEPIRDITEIDINRVLAITTSTPVKSRLYLCNTDTIPIPRLLQLEKGGGMFVQAFGHVSGEPPGQSWTERVEVNFLRACKDWLELPTPQSSSEQKEEEEAPVVNGVREGPAV